MNTNTHDTDFYTWTQEQAALLRKGNLAELDIPNLIEEIEDMGRSERRELENRLSVLLMHLLKWQYQMARRGKSWRLTITGQRYKVSKVLRENPGLKIKLNSIICDAYGDARYDAAKETDINMSDFPGVCPWSFEQIINDEFWPD